MNQPPQALASSHGLSRVGETMASVERLFQRHAAKFLSKGRGFNSRDRLEPRPEISEAKRRQIIQLRAKGHTNREIAKAAECDLSNVLNVLCGFAGPDR